MNVPKFIIGLFVSAAVIVSGCGQPAPSTADSAPVGNAESQPAADAGGSNCQFVAAPGTESFDVVILNGRVMDPACDFDGVRNVGVKGGRIG